MLASTEVPPKHFPNVPPCSREKETIFLLAFLSGFCSIFYMVLGTLNYFCMERARWDTQGWL